MSLEFVKLAKEVFSCLGMGPEQGLELGLELGLKLGHDPACCKVHRHNFVYWL
jgi:hypothetical protein